MQSFIIEHSLLLLLLLLLLLVFTLWCSKNTFTGGEESECDRHPFSGRNALPHVGIHSCYGWSDLGAAFQTGPFPYEENCVRCGRCRCFRQALSVKFRTPRIGGAAVAMGLPMSSDDDAISAR